MYVDRYDIFLPVLHHLNLNSDIFVKFKIITKISIDVGILFLSELLHEFTIAL
jgi:hypothetical protein